MTSDEVWDLLGVISSFDRRKLNPADGPAWEAVVGDLPFGECRDAVVAHYRTRREWIMPADIRNAVKALVTERLNRNPVRPPPPELTDDPQAYIQALKGNISAAVANGDAPRAIEGGHE